MSHARLTIKVPTHKPLLDANSEPGTPLRGEPSTPVRDEPSLVSNESHQKSIKERVAEQVKSKLKFDKSLSIGGRAITINDGDFKDSDGNMSVISVVTATDTRGIPSTMLLKSIQIKPENIGFLLCQSMRRKNEGEGVDQVVDSVSTTIVSNMKDILTNEHKIATAVYPSEPIHLSDDGTKMLMPFFPGEKLYDKKDEGDKNFTSISLSSFEDRLKLISLLINEMDKMHQLNIGHFDVKPQNILYKPKDEKNLDQIYFIDFGTSHQFKDKSEFLYDNRGTPLYRAPETRESPHHLGLKGDDYSMGKIIEEILFETPLSEKEASATKKLAGEIIMQFVYRMQGKNSKGELIPFDENYMKDVYGKLRPEIDEPKKFFDQVQKLMAILSGDSPKKESEAQAIVEKLKTFIPASTPTPALIERSPGSLGIFGSELAVAEPSMELTKRKKQALPCGHAIL